MSYFPQHPVHIVWVMLFAYLNYFFPVYIVWESCYLLAYLHYFFPVYIVWESCYLLTWTISFLFTGSRGGRGPGSIADLVETPGDATTVHSWDSHAHYKHHLPGDSPDHSIFSGVVLVFDETHLKSSIGFIRLLLVVRRIHHIYHQTFYYPDLVRWKINILNYQNL